MHILALQVAELYEILQILSLSLTNKTHLKRLVLIKINFNITKNNMTLMRQDYLIIFNRHIFIGHE